MTPFIHCPVCPALHPILRITIERDRAGAEQHLAHVACEAAGREITAQLELAPPHWREARP